MIMPVFLFLSLFSAPQETGGLAVLLEKKEPEAVDRFLKAHREESERYFQTQLDMLLKAKLEDENRLVEKITDNLSFLAERFRKELKEQYPSAFLKQYCSWNKKQIKSKFRADALSVRAQALWRAGRRDQAHKDLQEMHSVCRTLSYIKGLADAFYLEGKCSWIEGRGQEAEAFLTASLKAAEQDAYTVAVKRVLSPLGTICLRRGNHKKAELLFQKSLALFRQEGDEKGESWSLACLGNATLQTGRLVTARIYYQKALSLPGRDTTEDARLYHGLGKVYSEQHRHLAAFKAFEKARTLPSSDELTTTILIDLAALWRRQGDLDRSETVYREALASAEARNNETTKAAIRNNLGNLYLAQGKYRKAEDLYRKALKREREVHDTTMVGRILTNLVILAWEEGDLEGTALRAEEAFSVVSEAQDRACTAELEKALGLVALSKNKIETARTHLQKAKTLFSHLRDGKGIALAQSGMGKTFLKTDENEKAAACFTEAITVLESQRRQVTSGHYRDFFLNRNEVREPYTLLAKTLIAQGDGAKAFEAAEKSKAQGLAAELLSNSEKPVDTPVPPPLREKIERLLARQAFLRGRLVKEQGEEYKRLVEEFDRNEKTASLLQEKIWAAFPRTRPLQASSAKDVQTVLEPGTLLCEYLLGKEESFLFALTCEKLSVFTLPGEAAIEEQVEEVLAYCRVPFASEENGTEKTAALLLGPVFQKIERAKKLVIVPEGILGQLPFGVLRPHGTKRLIERLPLLSLPSASIAAQADIFEAAEKPEGAFVFGAPDYSKERVFDPGLPWGTQTLPPLTASRSEAERIAGLLDAKLYLGAQATETQLKNILPTARYLHLAVHSFIHPHRPELTCFVLSPETHTDGILELRELPRTACELVVLSACKSGLGEAARGEGYLGLGRGLLEAGARQVLLSFWNVHDQAAAELMPLFWSSFLEERDGASALRKAKLSFLRKAALGEFAFSHSAERGIFKRVKKKNLDPAHPFFWAGFVLIGREAGSCTNK